MTPMQSLGRGLGSLIKPMVPTAAPSSGVLFVPLGRISPNPLQPRLTMPHHATDDLVASIKLHGILQPLVVSPKGEGYELIAGERRFRAAGIAGLTTVPVIIRSVNDQEKLELALIENIQREDLNPLEEAHAYQKLAEQFDLTQEEIAARVGKSRSVVANTVRLLALPPQIQDAVRDGQIPATAARAIAGLKSAGEQIAWFAKIASEKLAVREIESKIARTQPRGASRRGVGSDPDLRAAEEELTQALGTKVRIKKIGKTGRIEIEFYSDEELAALTGRLKES